VQPILNEEDFASMVLQEHSVIYFYVDWSVHAVQGRRILEELESSWSQGNSTASFWLADVSDLNAPAAFLAEWLNGQERSELKTRNVVTAGSGSVAWLNRGEVIDFVQTATQHDVRALVHRTKSAFGESAT
jgi:hypothetical protein